MAESNFRANLTGFAWARGVTDDSRTGAATSSGGQADGSSTPFGRFSSSISGYIPVRSAERTNEEEASVPSSSPPLHPQARHATPTSATDSTYGPHSYFALSRWERFLGFLLCTAGAAACFLISFFIGLPLLAIKPRKFAVSFSLGSILFMAGFAILQGPTAHLKHIFTSERLPFTGAYLGSLALTLYFALGRRSYLPTLICAIVQCAALISYLVAYFPGGWQTLSFGSRMALRAGNSMLPV